MTLKKLLIVSGLLMSSVVQVQASELLTYLKDLHTLEAKFTQTVFTDKNTVKQKSTGHIAVKSPDKFYLAYTEPYKLVYVADGKKLWSYDEDLEQVVVKPQGNELINTPAMLLGNPKDLTESYNIEKTGVIDGWLWFELTPKQQSNNFETVGLAFAENKLKAMEMRDNFGQTTRLEFSSVVKNPALSKNRFKFVAPAGVDVIGQ